MPSTTQSWGADILQDYTPAALEPLVGARLGGAIYVIARLSFLASVVTLFPLMVRSLESAGWLHG